MRLNRSWMLRRKDNTGLVSEEFKDGVDDFIKVAKGDPTIADALSRIPCPCARCKNRVRKESFWVEKDLYHYGFMEDYVNWTIHGEDRWGDNGSTSIAHDDKMETRNPNVDMVLNAAGDKVNLEGQDLGEDPNLPSSKFYDLLQDANEPLWNGCHQHTKLSAITQLLNLKSEFNMSESCYDKMIVIIKSMLPASERFPENFFISKRIVNELHTRGSISFSQHNKKTEVEQKHPMSFRDVHNHVHQKKDGEYDSQRSKNFIDSYDIARSEKYGENCLTYPVVEPKVLLDAVGSNKKARVFDMGHSLDIGIHSSMHSLFSEARGPCHTKPLTQADITEVVNTAVSSFAQTQLMPMLEPMLSRILGFPVGSLMPQAPPQGEETKEDRKDDDGDDDGDDDDSANLD